MNASRKARAKAISLDNLIRVNRILARAYAAGKAAVVELLRAQTSDPFRILVAVLLSARTRDQVTARVVERLFAAVRTPEDLAALSVDEISALIYPTGFYRTKARHLKALPEVLAREFGGRIPDTIDELCRLPGVGRKTANLVVSTAFDKPGICVDVHVHRICNRWGFVHTRTPYDTEMALRAVLPRRYWKNWNRYLVSYGQTLCLPRHPRCGRCDLRGLCAYGREHVPCT